MSEMIYNPLSGELEMAGVSVVINGDVTNYPDNEDITADENNKLSLKDRIPSFSKGYKIIRRGVDLASQFNQENTIYEIRYDFDLGGSTLAIPSDCTLKFEGGTLKNGTVVGNFSVQGEVTNKNVYADGYNFFTSEEYYTASAIGMIPNDAAYSEHNSILLDKVLNNKKGLIIDNHYHIAGIHDVDFVFKLRGSGTVEFSESNLFHIATGGGYDFKDVTFIGDDCYIMDSRAAQNNSYRIDKIVLKNCRFIKCNIIYVTWGDYAYDGNWGIKEFKIEDCEFTNAPSWICCINNAVVSDICLFSNNKVYGLISSCLYFALNNEYSNNNKNYHADIVFKNNNIEGTIVDNSNYYTPLLVDSHVKNCYYSNNIIKNMIGIGDGGVTYDAYGSCENFYSENNTFVNVLHLNKNGIVSNYGGEIFKSKAAGTVRHAKNNIWTLDFDECRTLCLHKRNITWTDEQFKNIAWVGIFGFVETIGTLVFESNRISIKGGALKLSNTTRHINMAQFCNNYIQADRFINSMLLPVDLRIESKITMKGNTILCDAHDLFSFTSTPAFCESFNESYNHDITIENNFTTVTLCTQPKGLKKAVVRNNTGVNIINMGTAQFYDCGDKSIVDMPFVTSASGQGFYFSMLKNVEYNFEFCVPENLYNSDGVHLLIFQDSENGYVIEACGTEIKIKDGKLYDKYDNQITVSSYANIVSDDRCSLVSWGANKVAIRAKDKPNFIISVKPYYKTPADKYTYGLYRFDTGLGKPLWWNGTAWVDASGEVVS